MSTVPKKKTRKAQQEVAITIAEFKQWLAGVEDMQESDWVPDAVQWAKIRAKVELLSEADVEHVEQYQHAPAYSPSPYYTPPVTAAQDYSSLGQYAPRPPTSSLLEGDGIMIPAPSQFDVQHDHPSLGPAHDPNGFA